MLEDLPSRHNTKRHKTTHNTNTCGSPSVNLAVEQFGIIFGGVARRAQRKTQRNTKRTQHNTTQHNTTQHHNTTLRHTNSLGNVNTGPTQAVKNPPPSAYCVVLTQPQHGIPPCLFSFLDGFDVFVLWFPFGGFCFVVPHWRFCLCVFPLEVFVLRFPVGSFSLTVPLWKLSFCGSPLEVLQMHCRDRGGNCTPQI